LLVFTVGGEGFDVVGKIAGVEEDNVTIEPDRPIRPITSDGFPTRFKGIDPLCRTNVRTK
jgi:hypothetical protein